MSSTFHPWSQFNHPETTVLEQLRTLKSVDILFKKFDRKFQDNQVDHGRQGWIFLVIREQLFPDNFFFSRRNIHFWEKYAPLSREEVDFVICNSNHPTFQKNIWRETMGYLLHGRRFPDCRAPSPPLLCLCAPWDGSPFRLTKMQWLQKSTKIGPCK